MSKIIRNSAKCNTCDVELESIHRHDFNPHYCPNNFVARMQWVECGDNQVLAEVVPREQDFTWFIDGGKDYIRRGGVGLTDTSLYAPEET
jgi:Zn-finger nucleic acid-binding protein